MVLSQVSDADSSPYQRGSLSNDGAPMKNWARDLED